MSEIDDARLLPRFFRRQQEAEDAARIARIVFETGEPAPVVAIAATLPGDTRRLRGIPVVGGASGTSPGTDPLREVIRREDDRNRC